MIHHINTGLKAENELRNFSEFSALNLDREILAQIFALILEAIVLPDQALKELKRAFDCVQENFASSGIFQQKRKVS